FLTDFLFNSPRLRFSRAQKRAILSWGKDLGAKEVPTLSSLQAVQKQLTLETRHPMSKKTMQLGNIFFINEIGAALAKDMGNLLVQLHMVFYPEDVGSESSQAWHGEKWLRHVSDELLMLTVKHMGTGHHFYVRELMKCLDGTYFIPERWFLKKGGKMWSRGHNVVCTEVRDCGSRLTGSDAASSY
ncbi:hypothetical protein K439DRAFT_1368905, partial [Ramaria rubella]